MEWSFPLQLLCPHWWVSTPSMNWCSWTRQLANILSFEMGKALVKLELEMMHCFSFSGFRAFKASTKNSHYLMPLQILVPKQTLEYCIFVLKQYEQSLTQLLVQSCPWEKFPVCQANRRHMQSSAMGEIFPNAIHVSLPYPVKCWRKWRRVGTVLNGAVNRHTSSFLDSAHVTWGSRQSNEISEGCTGIWSRFLENHMVLFCMEYFYSNSHLKHSAALVEEGASSLAYKCHVEYIDFEKVLLILK